MLWAVSQRLNDPKPARPRIAHRIVSSSPPLLFFYPLVTSPAAAVA